jgi:branched-chain amino acid transport system ATP-binding protein
LTNVVGKNGLLATQDLEAGYGDAQVLWGVNLEVREREIVGLLGGNGAGKSTLINTLSGLNFPTAGLIYFQGEEITSMDPYNRVKIGITQIPEGRQLFPGLTVRQNLLLGAFSLTEKSHVPQELNLVFHLFPILAERQSQLAGTLSGGEQQMCALGRGLMSSPRLLLIDELSLGLAPVVVERIVEALKKVYQEKLLSILLVEQDVHLCLELSGRAYVLETGRIVKQGACEELARDPQIRKSYLGI